MKCIAEYIFAGIACIIFGLAMAMKFLRALWDFVMDAIEAVVLG